MSNVTLPDPPKVKRRWWLYGVAALLLMGLVGTVMDGGTDAATPTVVTDPDPAPEPTDEPEPVDPAADTRALSVKLALLERGVIDMTDVPDRLIDKAGRKICAIARDAYPLSDSEVTALSLVTAQGLGIQPRKGAMVAGALIGAYCPEYLP